MENSKCGQRKKRRARIPKEFAYYNHMNFLSNPPSKQAQKDGVPFPTEKLSQYRDSKVRWNYESSMAVISAVKKHPVIWAPSKGHPPSSARTKAFCTVLDHLNSSVPAFIKDPITMNDLRCKWKRLRYYRARCIRNLKRKKSIPREWEFFHAMDFMDPSCSQHQDDPTLDSSLLEIDNNEFSNESQKAEDSSPQSIGTDGDLLNLETDTNKCSMESQKAAYNSLAESLGMNSVPANLQADTNKNSTEFQKSMDDSSVECIRANMYLVNFQAHNNMCSTKSQKVAYSSSADIIGMEMDREDNEQFRTSKRWNYEATMTVINEIKKCPVIWDFYNTSHLIDERFAAMDAIVGRLNSSIPYFINNPITMKELGWKWTSLRCYKKRCMRNMKKNPNLKEWEYFSALDFIERKQPLQAVSNQDSSPITKSTIKWNHVTTMALINEVKKYPEMWCEKNRPCQNTPYSYEVYAANKNIVTQLNASIPALKKNPITIRDMRLKWKYLRQYMRKVMRTESATGREWEFYSALDFLRTEFPSQQHESSPHNSLDAANSRLKAMVPDSLIKEDDCFGRGIATGGMDTSNSHRKTTTGHLPLKFESRWNHQTTMALIDEIKKHPDLWNQGARSRHHSSYKYDLYLANKNALANLNTSVASFRENPITIDEMRSKWKQLRTYMRKCLDSKLNKGKDWEFYNSLYFLKPHYYHQRRQDPSPQASLHTPSICTERSTQDAEDSAKDGNQLEPVIEVKQEPSPDHIEESAEEHLEVIDELISSSSPPINRKRMAEEDVLVSDKKPRIEATVDTHSAIPNPTSDSNPSHVVASTGYGDVSSSSNNNSSSLCTLGLMQIKYAFSMKQPSIQKQINFYQSISQLCAEFIGGSHRFSSNDGATQ